MAYYRAHILVCTGTGCAAANANGLAEEFEAQLKKFGLDQEIRVVKTGCLGLCAKGPNVVIYPDGTHYIMVHVEDVAEIDLRGLDPILKQTELVTMCDITNPMYGPNGAAYVFAPQKGADPDMVARLDRGLSHLAKVMHQQLGIDVALLPGAGAAGGMGGGMAAFFNSQLEPGIEAVLDTVGFDDLLADTTAVFTGEGKIDSQSLGGKVVIGVARRAKRQGVPVIAVVGDIGDPIDDAYDQGVSAIFSINRVAVPYAKARLRAKSDLEKTMENICRFWCI